MEAKRHAGNRGRLLDFAIHFFLTRINGKCIFNGNIMTLGEDELLFKLPLK